MGHQIKEILRQLSNSGKQLDSKITELKALIFGLPEDNKKEEGHSPEWWEERRKAEQYGWDNPVLSRKEVYELFQEIFKDNRYTIGNNIRISAFREVMKFNEQLRELAYTKAIEMKAGNKKAEENASHWDDYWNTRAKQPVDPDKVKKEYQKLQVMANKLGMNPEELGDIIKRSEYGSKPIRNEQTGTKKDPMEILKQIKAVPYEVYKKSLEMQLERIKKEGINADQEDKSPAEEYADAIVEKQMIEEIEGKLKALEQPVTTISEYGKQLLIAGKGLSSVSFDGQYKVTIDLSTLSTEQILEHLQKLPEDRQMEVATRILDRANTKRQEEIESRPADRVEYPKPLTEEQIQKLNKL